MALSKHAGSVQFKMVSINGSVEACRFSSVQDGIYKWLCGSMQVQFSSRRYL